MTYQIITDATADLNDELLAGLPEVKIIPMQASEVDARIKQLQDELAKLEHRAKPKPVTNYREKLTVLQYALEQYTHVDEGKDVPESVIEAFVERIVASPDGFEWFLRFEGEPDKPLFCQIEGKRKKSAKVMIAGEISPSEDCSGAGCYQGLIIYSINRPWLHRHGRFFKAGECHVYQRTAERTDSPDGCAAR